MLPRRPVLEVVRRQLEQPIGLNRPDARDTSARRCVVVAPVELVLPHICRKVDTSEEYPLGPSGGCSVEDTARMES